MAKLSKNSIHTIQDTINETCDAEMEKQSRGRPDNWNGLVINECNCHDLPKDYFEAGASAMLRAIYKWGNEPCPHEDSTEEILDKDDNVIGERPFPKRKCDKCWQDILVK